MWRIWLILLWGLGEGPWWGGLSGRVEAADLFPDQEYLVTTWGPNEGLSVNSIRDIVQTPDGYLWAGTLFNGLIRFDGERFVVFDQNDTPALTKSGVFRLMVDRSGLLWIDAYDGMLTTWTAGGFALVCTNAGRLESLLWSGPGRVIFLNNQKQIFAGRQSSAGWEWNTANLPGEISRIPPCADGEGNIWYLQGEHQIGVYRDGRVEPMAFPPGLGGKRIWALASDAMGNVWVGTEGGLAEWKTNQFVYVHSDDEGNGTFVKQLTPAGNSLWVQDAKRLRRFSNGQWLAEAEGWATNYASVQFRNRVGDDRGGLWATSDELGLVHVRADGTIWNISTHNGLPSNAFRCLTFDGEGNAWVGYEHGGLARVADRLFKVIGREQGLQEPLVNSVCQDSAGAIWIGTAGKIVSRYQDGKVVNFSLPLPPRARDVVVVSDAKNRVWAGASGSGLLLFTNGQFVPAFSPALLPGYVRLLLPDRDGRLWVGTLEAVYVVDDGRVTKVFDLGNADNRPAALAESSDGTIWMGTFRGRLLRWDGSAFVQLKVPDQNTIGRLWSLCPSPDGGLWMGTSEGGVLRWHEGKFRRLTTVNGLRSDYVVQVQLAVNGDLWLVTREGIERVDASALADFDRGVKMTVPVTQYAQSVGLTSIGGSMEFQPNCWRGRDGKLFFAMADNVAYVDSAAERSHPLPPTVIMEELRVDQTRVWPAQSAQVLAVSAMGGMVQPGGNLPPVIIPPGSHDLEFRFTGISFHAPQLLQFKYRLQGAEEEWHLAGGQRTAFYKFLPPGKYVFQVKAGSAEDVWNGGCAALGVILQPFYYQTALFQWAVGIGGVTAVALMVGNISRRRMRRRLELIAHQRELERNRAQIAKDVHDEIGAKLARISYMSELAKQENASTEKLHLRIDSIAETSRDLLQSLDEIVWAVNPQNDTLENLTAYLGHYAQEYFHGTSVDCEVEMPSILPEIPVASEVRHNLYLAFEESLTNVLKHAVAKHVRIEMKFESGRFEIVVKDDGRGLPAKAAGTAAHPNADGLRNMKQRLEQIGGSCTIEDLPGRGACVRLVLPIKTTHLKTNP